MTEHTIAVVEDDEDILANVCRFLQKAGFQVWGALSAEDFYVRLLRDKADLVVVDLGLPGESGLSLVQRLAQQRIPVIVQTALGGVHHRIEGLEAGALQYFVKPTDMHELVAGIRSQLRHLEAASAPPGAELGRWYLDLANAHLIAPNQRTVALTSRELEVISCLMKANGALVSKAALLAHLNLAAVEDGFHRIESLLTRLRRKTLQATGMPLPVRAVFGRGLVFVV